MSAYSSIKVNKTVLWTAQGNQKSKDQLSRSPAFIHFFPKILKTRDNKETHLVNFSHPNRKERKAYNKKCDISESFDGDDDEDTNCSTFFLVHTKNQTDGKSESRKDPFFLQTFQPSDLLNRTFSIGIFP